MAGRNAACGASPRRRRRARVRSMQLADHLVDDVQKLLPITDVLHQRFVFCFRRVPILTVHRRIVKAILHRTPCVAEHLGPFSRMIDLYAHVKADAPARAFASASGWSTSRGRRAGGCAPPLNPCRLSSLPLPKEKRA